jgi:hypothetical protein
MRLRGRERVSTAVTGWLPPGAAPNDATGGTKTTETIDGVTYNIHTFNDSGTFTPLVVIA